MIIIWIVAILVVLAAILLYWFGGRSYFSPLSSLQATPQASSGTAGTASPDTKGSGNVTPTPKATKSPTPTPAATSKSITVGSNSAVDGFESSNGGGNTGLDIRAGRNSNLVTRGFVSFNVPSEVSGKTIDKVVMRLYQGQIIGSPYTPGGSLKVDHLDYGPTLENADYSQASLSSNFATLTGNATVEWKDLVITDQFKDDMGNGRARSQYRIHFATEAVGGDVTGDFTYFESQDNSIGTGNRPQLVITYH